MLNRANPALRAGGMAENGAQTSVHHMIMAGRNFDGALGWVKISAAEDDTAASRERVHRQAGAPTTVQTNANATNRGGKSPLRIHASLKRQAMRQTIHFDANPVLKSAASAAMRMTAFCGEVGAKPHSVASN
jgi:hypothetical protein